MTELIIKNDNTPSHFVGIGASAGGLEALQELFEYLPCDTGAGYIVIQHLSPDFKSMMKELLKKTTNMPIIKAVDGIDVKANHIYLMPPRTNMLIGDGKLILTSRMPDGQVHQSIDVFLRSLAADQQHRAIAIILSGTGSDGTRGIKALKESGGLVIIQDPNSAKFDGMPRSAYNTGLADFLLPPKEIGEKLAQFIRHPVISGTNSPLQRPIADDDSTLAEIFELLKNKCSISFTEYKASTVARRIERRLGINQINTIEEYLRRLKDSPRELQILSKELLVSVTRFFRDDEAFRKLKTDIVPNVIDRYSSRRGGIRIWVAGCATGEEVFSLAILFEEERLARGLDFSIKIFATDVDEDSVAQASAGIFSLDIEQDVSEERLQRFFNKKEDRYEIAQHIRQMVIFATHNMIDDPPFSNISLVSCRNVLIYLQQPAQQKVLSSLYFSLAQSGVLFLGLSESLGDLKTHFDILDERLRFFQKINNLRTPVHDHFPANLNYQTRTIMPPPPVSYKPGRFSGKNPLQNVFERLIGEYAPPCIVINELFEAVHVFGDVRPFTQGMKQGKISNNIKDIIADDLSIPVSTALSRCEKNAEDIFYSDIVIKISEKEQICIDLTVFVVTNGDLSNNPQYYIIQFDEHDDDAEGQNKPKKVTYNATEQSRQRISDLEQELIKKQEHLQVTVEELETTNEELQSANEELMSANEELQSTNEELQSVNEELYTVNTEYQEKINELTEANIDRDSVINATEISIIFLDENLAIRKYTPDCVRYIELRNTDIGRPFHHISHSLHYENLMTDIAEVSKNGIQIERNVTSEQNYSLQIRILPYRKNTNPNQSGVLITITNVSRLKFVEDALQNAQSQLRNLLLNKRELKKRTPKKKLVNVLLIDDNQADLKHLHRLLEDAKGRAFNIHACTEIAEAIKVANEKPIDICFCDYKLSGGSAKDVIRKMNTAKKDIPVIVISGYSEIGLDIDFLNNEVSDFLNKEELSTQLLTHSIDYALERKNVRDVLAELS